MKRVVMETAGQHYRSEFFERVDESVVFSPLSSENIRMNAGIQIQHLTRRLEDRQMELVVTDAALDLLGKAGIDPVHGTASFCQEFQQQVENLQAQACSELKIYRC